MASVFTRIMNAELPGHMPYVDERCVVLMSINPIAPGHCLVIPREETDQWTDLDPDIAAHLMLVAHRLGGILRTEFPCDRVGLIIAGFEVAHCHLHVIPTRSMADLDFTNAESHVDQSVLAMYAAQIAAHYS
jgi:diadenosine tetraphosphate (Ap4A) HIT family hydrolase